MTIEALVDQNIVCKDCQTTFTFTASEQRFFADRNFTPPLRCKPCRDLRKMNRDGGGGGNPGLGFNSSAPKPTAAVEPPPAQRRASGRGGSPRRGGRRDDAWD